MTARNPDPHEQVTIIEMHCRELVNKAVGAMLASYDHGHYTSVLNIIDSAIADIVELSTDKARGCPVGTYPCGPGICCPDINSSSQSTK